MPTENQFPKLPEDFKRRWVDALRSGNYKQGRIYLCNGDTYCCLGVAGAICGIPIDLLATSQFLHSQIPEKKLANVPVQIRGTRVGNDLVRFLTEMNDIKEATFSDIADWIEKNL